jgi:hypothetical protein
MYVVIWDIKSVSRLENRNRQSCRFPQVLHNSSMQSVSGNICEKKEIFDVSSVPAHDNERYCTEAD